MRWRQPPPAKTVPHRTSSTTTQRMDRHHRPRHGIPKGRERSTTTRAQGHKTYCCHIDRPTRPQATTSSSIAGGSPPRSSRQGRRWRRQHGRRRETTAAQRTLHVILGLTAVANHRALGRGRLVPSARNTAQREGVSMQAGEARQRPAQRHHTSPPRRRLRRASATRSTTAAPWRRLASDQLSQLSDETRTVTNFSSTNGSSQL